MTRTRFASRLAIVCSSEKGMAYSGVGVATGEDRERPPPEIEKYCSRKRMIFQKALF